MGKKLFGFSSEGKKAFCIPPFEYDIDIAPGYGRTAFTVPTYMDGMILIDVIASVYDPGIGGTTSVQIRRKRGAVQVDMLLVPVIIGENEYFAGNGTVHPITNLFREGDQVYADVLGVHSTPPRGLSVVCIANEL